METKDKVKRIGELMLRKDEIELEREKLDEQRNALTDEYDRIDDELVTLMGVKPANQPNGERKQITCKTPGCGQKGHNSKGHDKWVLNNPDHPWVKAHALTLIHGGASG